MASRKIFVVENDDAIRRMLMTLLEAEGYDVRGASNGAEALDLDPRWQPELILLDLMMPIMGGREFLERRAAVEHLAGVWVIVSTADADEAASLDSSSGVRAVLTKPHDVEALRALIEQTLGEPSSAQFPT